MSSHQNTMATGWVLSSLDIYFAFYYNTCFKVIITFIPCFFYRTMYYSFEMVFKQFIKISVFAKPYYQSTFIFVV